jgi:tRNA pseudouridine38-40 synthase
LRQAARVFEGTHDFAAFSARRSAGDRDTRRRIDSIAVHSAGPEILMDFRGPGFLYKMVRIVTAAIVRHAAGRCPLMDLQERLQSGGPSFQHTAPAEGLCLEEVFYPPP